MRIRLWCSVLILGCALTAFGENSGETLFKSTCARCHGEDGSARTAAAAKMKVADLRSDNVQRQSDDELFASIGHGTRHKQYPHAFLDRGISEAQVRGVIAYIRTLKAK